MRWLGESAEVGREKLRAILKDGVMRLDTTSDTMAEVSATIFPTPIVYSVGRKRETLEGGSAFKGSALFACRSGGPPVEFSRPGDLIPFHFATLQPRSSALSACA